MRYTCGKCVCGCHVVVGVILVCFTSTRCKHCIKLFGGLLSSANAVNTVSQSAHMQLQAQTCCNSRVVRHPQMAQSSSKPHTALQHSLLHWHQALLATLATELAGVGGQPRGGQPAYNAALPEVVGGQVCCARRGGQPGDAVGHAVQEPQVRPAVDRQCQGSMGRALCLLRIMKAGAARTSHVRCSSEQQQPV